MEGQAPILTSLELYRSEVLPIQWLTRIEEQALVTAARHGDGHARTRLIESCLNYVAAVAWRYVCYLTSDDYLDIVSVGNLVLVESCERALTMVNPPAYLRKVAKWEMFRYCYYRSRLITRNPGHKDVPEVISLTEAVTPLHHGESTTSEPKQPILDRTTLVQTIARLPTMERHVVLRHTGLDGKKPESLTAIGKRISANPKGSLACYYWQQGVKRLQELLVIQSTKPGDFRRRKSRTTARVLAAVNE